jgi:hypothetical protein
VIERMNLIKHIICRHVNITMKLEQLNSANKKVKGVVLIHDGVFCTVSVHSLLLQQNT